MNLSINNHDIHIWSSSLAIDEKQEELRRNLLSEDECERADRFQFAKHKRRFIAARSFLRQTLSNYLNCDPKEINFAYTEYNKPFILSPITPIQFNLSHSHEMAVYALSLAPIGIDIEKIQTRYDPALAQRFFSKQENDYLLSLPQAQRIKMFYQIWSSKEAFIKAVGKGLHISLSSFSIKPPKASLIDFDHHTWYLAPLALFPEYQTAIASAQAIKKIDVWTRANTIPTPYFL